MECQAPLRDVNVTFQPYQKSDEQQRKPWGNLVPNSEAYLNLFVETAVELQKKKHIPLQKAYLELLKEGWPLDVENMDEELIKAAKDAGLLNEPATEEPSGNENPPASSGNSLEDIIKAMNEEQK